MLPIFVVARLSLELLNCILYNKTIRGEWPSGLYSLRQVTEVKFGRVRSNSRWVTLEA